MQFDEEVKLSIGGVRVRTERTSGDSIRIGIEIPSRALMGF